MSRIEEIRRKYDPDQTVDVNLKTGHIRQKSTGLYCTLLEWVQAQYNFTEAEALEWLRKTSGVNVTPDDF